MAIDVWLENIGGPKGGNPIPQHAATLARHDSKRKPSLDILAGDDLIVAILDKEIRPFFQPVGIEYVNVIGEKRINAQARDETGAKVHVFQRPPFPPLLTVSCIRAGPSRGRGLPLQ